MTTGGTGALKLFEDLILSRDRVFAENVALGLLFRDRDAGIFGNGLACTCPPFLKFVSADDLSEDDLDLDLSGGVVLVGLEGFDEELGRFICDELINDIRLGFLADKKMVGRQHIHGRNAERRIHFVTGLIGKVDAQALFGFVIILD